MARELAVHGGRPAFEQPRHVGEPNVTDQAAFLRRVADILERRRFTNNGPFVAELEEIVSARLGVAECVAVSNATIGLQLVLSALAVTGEVVVPSWTFIATPHAAQISGLRVRFVDVDRSTHTVSPEHLRRLVNDDTAAIIGVHLFGQPCDVAALEDIAGPLDIPVIYDAAHALGVNTETTPIGNHGEAEVFSLHATKFVHGFEGGLITTNDKALADELRLLRNFGFTNSGRVARLGMNAKLSEIHAAMAVTQFESMDKLREINATRHTAYSAGTESIPGLELFQPDAAVRNDQYVVFDVEPAVTGITRDELIVVLEAEGVLARRYFAPGCHRQMPYVIEQPGAGRWLPGTEELCERTLVLPTGPNMSVSDVEIVTEVLASAVSVNRRLKRSCTDLVSSR
jgi:dTDP-4-amino-4,6-dideoxygalactose transaminase